MATLLNQPDDDLLPNAGSSIDGYYDGNGLSATTRHILTLIRRNVLLISTIIAAIVAIAVVYTMLQTPRFTATTSVQINTQSDQILGDQLGDKSSVSSDETFDVDRFLNTQLEILRSRSLAERVERRLNLGSDTRFFAAMNVKFGEGKMSGQASRKLAIDLARGNMSVDLPRETKIAQISFTSTDPAYSAKIANAFAEEFIQSNLQRRYDSSAYARAFVSQQMDEARVRLENSERELNSYARQAGLIRSRISSGSGSGSGEGSSSDSGAASVTLSSLGQINEAANRAKAALTEAESRWQAENSVPLMQSQTVLGNGTVQQLLTQKAALESQLQAQKTRYLPDHPSVRALEAQLAAISTQLRSVAQGIRNGVRSDYQSARDTEARLREQVNSLQGETMTEQDRSVRYNTLAREADTNRQLYDGLLQRFRELNAAAGISSSNVAVIDTAQVPGSPSSPNLMKNVGIAAVLGMALAFAVVFLRDQLDDRVRMPEDVEAKVNLPLLGVIPKETEDDLASQLADPKSPLSEAYSSLRGSLMYSTTEGLPHILLITSSQQSEGKSTTSFATARALSRVGKKVLLVDADMRRPSLHHRVSLPNESGLSTLLTSPGMDVSSVINPTGEENLFVVTAGPHPPSPSELLASPRMALILEEFAKNFDAVVVDSPPVLGLADAPVLSAIVDGVAFVIEAESGQRGAVKAALRRLRAMKPQLVGAILTKFDPKKSANRYSSYYGYEYYRYKSDEA
ncbi:MAG: hypothetical protein RIS94_782 [Pseudomonadota bacterium]